MRKITAGRFGSFFLYLIPFLLIGIMILGNGCSTSPAPAPSIDEQSEGKVITFYSRPEKAAEDKPISSTPVPSPSPDIISGETDSTPVEQPDLDSPALEETSDYLISSNDVLKISVLGEEDLSITARVSERGAISFPLLGEVRAVGYTPIQFERRLEELLGKDYLVSPSVNISILEYSTISVLGQVKKPGAYEMKGKMTVSRAIALAGGLTKIASPNGTQVIRKENGREKVISVPLKDIMVDGDLSGDIPLKSGDLVVVPESFF